MQSWAHRGPHVLSGACTVVYQSLADDRINLACVLIEYRLPARVVLCGHAHHLAHEVLAVDLVEASTLRGEVSEGTACNI